jgi:hypothetical protein
VFQVASRPGLGSCEQLLVLLEHKVEYPGYLSSFLYVPLSVVPNAETLYASRHEVLA